MFKRLRINRFFGYKKLWWYLFFIIALIHIFPIWFVDIYPTQDGPSHAYNAKIIKEILSDCNYHVNSLYEFNHIPVPNILTYLLMSILNVFFHPIIVEKIIQTFTIILYPLSLFCAIQIIDKCYADANPGDLRSDNRYLCLLGFIYIYNECFQLGFYAFSIGMALFVLAFTKWLQWRSRITSWRILGYILLSLFIYFNHLAPYVVLQLSVVSICSYTIVLSFAKHLYSCIFLKKHGTTTLRSWVKGEEFQSNITYLIVSFPLILLGYTYVKFELGKPSNFRGFQFIVDILTKTHSIVTVEDHRNSILILLSCFILLICFIVYERLRHRCYHTSRDILCIPIIVCLFFLFKQSGQHWGVQRLFLLTVSVFFLWIDFRSKFLKFLMVIAISLVSIHRTVVNFAVADSIQADLLEFISLRNCIVPHSTVECFVKNYRVNNRKKLIGYNPINHLFSYYGINEDVVLLDNYEGRTNHFPLKYKRGLKWVVPDYKIYFGDGYADLNSIDGYTLIHSCKQIKLFGCKELPSETPTKISNKEYFKFDMGGEVTSSASSVKSRHAVCPDQKFIGGTCGWLNGSSELIDNDVAYIDKPIWAKQSIGGKDINTFRVSVPNGEYRLILGYSSFNGFNYGTRVHVNGVFEREDLINDNIVFKKVIVPVEVKSGVLDITFSGISSLENNLVMHNRWMIALIELERKVEAPLGFSVDFANVPYKRWGSRANVVDFSKQFLLRVNRPHDNAKILYTVDGTVPYLNSNELNGSEILIKNSTFLYAKMFKDNAFTGAETAVSLKKKNEDDLIEMKISSSNSPLDNLDSVNPESLTFSKQVRIPTINFPLSGCLQHETKGEIFAGNDFVVDFTGTFFVKNSGVYSFDISSDDGCKLFIDKRVIINSPKWRRFSKSTGEYYLNRGVHHFSVRYFQGRLRAGVQAFYRKKGSLARSLLGEESADIVFISDEN